MSSILQGRGFIIQEPIRKYGFVFQSDITLWLLEKSARDLIRKGRNSSVFQTLNFFPSNLCPINTYWIYRLYSSSMIFSWQVCHTRQWRSYRGATVLLRPPASPRLILGEWPGTRHALFQTWLCHQPLQHTKASPGAQFSSLWVSTTTTIAKTPVTWQEKNIPRKFNLENSKKLGMWEQQNFITAIKLSLCITQSQGQAGLTLL